MMSAVRVHDSRLPALGGDKTTLLVTDGPAAVQYQAFQPGDGTSTNPNIQIDLPGAGVGLSRNLYWRATGTFTVTGTNLDLFANANAVALRAFPLQSMTNNVNLTLGTSSVSIGNLNQIIAGLMAVGNPISSSQGIQSTSPTAPDWYADYGNAVGTLSSPFAASGDTPVSTQVGAARTVGITSIVITGTTSMAVNFSVSEPLVIAPFGYTDSAAEKAIYGCKQVTFSAQMSAFNRGLSLAIPATATVTNITLALASQSLLATFITPPMSTLDPMGLYRYDLPTLQSFTSNITGGTVAAGAQITATSQVCVASVIPSHIICMAVYSEADRQNAAISLPDAFMPIVQATAQVNSRSGIFSGASDVDLWRVSWKNGCKTPYHLARALPQASSTVGTGGPRGCGAPFVIDVAADCGLGEGVTPGQPGQFSFVLNYTVENNFTSALTAPRLIVIFVTGGYAEIMGGMVTIVNGGVMMPLDAYPIARAITSAEYHESTAESGYGGSKIGDWFKNAGKNIGRAFKNAAGPLANAGVAIGSFLQPELAPALAAARMGMRMATGRGIMGGAPSAGAMSGGARVTRAMLYGE